MLGEVLDVDVAEVAQAGVNGDEIFLDAFDFETFEKLAREVDAGGGSYYGAVSALVAEEKISPEELKELLRLVEQKGK